MILPLDEQDAVQADFLIDMFNHPDAHMFWGTGNRKYKTLGELLSTFNAQLGFYKIFISYLGNVPSGIFVAHSISIKNHRAELMAVISKGCRGKPIILSWWIEFLLELGHIGIKRIFAKVYAYNTHMLDSAKYAGFRQCGTLPDYVCYNGQIYDTMLFTRTIELTPIEKRWQNKQIAKQQH